MVISKRPFELTPEKFSDQVHFGLGEVGEVLMLRKIPLRMKKFFSRHFSPARIFVLSFAGVILTGGIIL